MIAENNASNRAYGKPGRREVEEVKAQVKYRVYIKANVYSSSLLA